MNEGIFVYLLFTTISLYLSKKIGSIRNIGFYWSVVFSIFCPAISILIIFCSNKKDDKVVAPNIIKWGIFVTAILILNIIEGYPGSLYKILGSVSLPFSIFFYRLTAELVGEMVVENFMIIFPIYALLRKGTSKFMV